MIEAGRCAANNVDWYVSVLGAHGIAGSVDRGVWLTRAEVPPYHSNAVTVAPGPVDEQLAAIADLAAGLQRPFTVKDAFARLDLAPLGFEVLIAAEWIVLDPDVALDGGARADGDVAWRTVTAPRDLGRWEAAWREGGSPATTRVFPPALLADPAIRFVAAERDGRIVAGCAANRSPDAIGFSNLFVLDEDADAMLAGAVAWTAALAPSLPVVGWESGGALDRAVRLGFRTVGPLRIWIHGSAARDA